MVNPPPFSLCEESMGLFSQQSGVPERTLSKQTLMIVEWATESGLSEHIRPVVLLLQSPLYLPSIAKRFQPKLHP